MDVERLTHKTGGKYSNTIIEQAPPYSIDCDVDTAITKLAEYEDLEEQEKLLKLPCKVGDTVYKSTEYYKVPIEEKIKMIYLNEDNTLMMQFFGHDRELSEIGKTVFLTQEEAEAALQKMNEREDKKWQTE